MSADPQRPRHFYLLGVAMILVLIGGYAPARAAEGGNSAMPPPWLARMNMYRAMEDLTPLASDAELTDADQNHAKYLAMNYADGVRGGAANPVDMHSEVASRKFYTKTGKRAAPGCEVDFQLGEHLSQDGAIDTWMEGPLHRMLLLNPFLKRIGYGYFCGNSVCVQTIDVTDGVRNTSFNATKQTAIEFPPANSTLSMYQLQHEMPDPLRACPGYAYPVGLPITFQVGLYASAKLTSYSIVKKDDLKGPPIEACGYDAYSYRNDAADQKGRVAGGLKAFGAVVVIPRRPLAPGNYRANLTVNGDEYSWSFSIAPHETQAAASR